MTEVEAVHAPHCACAATPEYRLTAQLDGDEVRWQLLEQVADGWLRVGEWETAVPPNGHYEDGGLSRMREYGVDPNLATVHLALPDCERTRPAT